MFTFRTQRALWSQLCYNPLKQHYWPNPNLKSSFMTFHSFPWSFLLICKVRLESNPMRFPAEGQIRLKAYLQAFVYGNTSSKSCWFLQKYQEWLLNNNCLNFTCLVCVLKDELKFPTYIWGCKSKHTKSNQSWPSSFSLIVANNGFQESVYEQGRYLVACS